MPHPKISYFYSTNINILYEYAKFVRSNGLKLIHYYYLKSMLYSDILSSYLMSNFSVPGYHQGCHIIFSGFISLGFSWL